MRSLAIFGFIVLIFGCKPSQYLQKDSVQLSKPIIEIEEMFFEESTTISISSTAENAKIIYTDFNGKSQRYQTPIVLTESSRIVFQSTGGGYVASDSVFVEVLKMPKNKISSIDSDRELNDKYGKEGLTLLTDRMKGGQDFNMGWLGYLGGTIVYDLEFENVEVDHLILSTLRNQGAWIFSPEKVNVYHDGNVIAELNLDTVQNEAFNSNIFTKIPLPKIETSRLTVEIIASREIPAWHSGAGNKPWVFIDEILIY